MKPLIPILLALLPLAAPKPSADPTPFMRRRPDSTPFLPRGTTPTFTSCLTSNTPITSPDPTFTTCSHTPTTRSPAAASALCSTPAFAPTIDNWWTSGATEWVKEYTRAYNDTERYKQLGLAGHLAETYLGRECRVDIGKTCKVECSEVAEKVEDEEEARIVWFVLRSVENMVGVGRVLHDTLTTAAQINMAEANAIIDKKTIRKIDGFNEYMWATTHNNTVNTLSSLFTTFFPVNVDLTHINRSITSLADSTAASLTEATVAVEELKAQIRVPGIEDALEEATKKRDNLERKSRRMANTASNLEAADLLLDQVVSSVFENVNAEMNATYPESEKGKKGSELEFDSFIWSSFMRASSELKKGMEVLLNGSMVENDGSSVFSNFMMGGNFLPDINDEAAKLRDSGIEQNIIRGLMLKILNAALNSQNTYITCTKDYRRTLKPYEPSIESKSPTNTCKRDNSGPQDFKACINDYVCYIYKWNNSGLTPGWHNEKIFGPNIVDEVPWNIDVTDIITSSVNAYFADVRGTKSLVLSSLSEHDPVAPGVFNIPVCFSKYNWATVVDGYRFPKNIAFDVQPRHSIKNLPCNCGPWGRDTEQVWREVGLWSEKGSKDWRRFADYREKCGYQIYDKIADPVERYVAFCRVEIYGRMGGKVRPYGKDWDCDSVISVLERLGYPGLKDLAPQVYHALYCRVVRHPKGSMCKGYKGQPLEELLDQMNVEIPRIGEVKGV